MNLSLVVPVLVLAVACSTTTPGRPAAGGPAGTVRATVTATASAPARGSTTAAPTRAPLRRWRPAPAGSLVDAAVPEASRYVSLDVAFSGLVTQTIGPGTAEVVYPWLVLTASRSGQAEAHVKLPYFICPQVQGAAVAVQERCHGRRVLYGDADSQSMTVTVDATGQLTVDLEVATYRYGSDADRTRALRPRASRATSHLHAVVSSGEVLQQQGRTLVWRPLATVSGVTALDGAARSTTTAGQDDGYDNIYRLVLAHG